MCTYPSTYSQYLTRKLPLPACNKASLFLIWREVHITPRPTLLRRRPKRLLPALQPRLPRHLHTRSVPDFQNPPFDQLNQVFRLLGGVHKFSFDYEPLVNELSLWEPSVAL